MIQTEVDRMMQEVESAGLKTSPTRISSKVATRRRARLQCRKLRIGYHEIDLLSRASTARTRCLEHASRSLHGLLPYSMGLVKNCFIMRNTLNEEKPNDKFEGVDKKRSRMQCRRLWFGWG